MNNVQFVKKSSNAKTGPIPTTTSARATCPPACPLQGPGGCYAEAGFHTRLNWDKVDAGERGTDYQTFLASIAKLPANQLWRHNVAGDLMGVDNQINGTALQALTRANQGARGFTYTHYPMQGSKRNLRHVRDANNNGFTVNLSANSISEAIETRKAYQLPTVTMMPEGLPRTIKQDGQTIVTCPATYKDDITCATCQLCQVADRSVIVGFPVHGPRKRAANIIATSGE